MDRLKRLCFVVFGSFLSSFILIYECRKLEGYKFPVYTTKSCPMNETEWEARSSVFNCQGESSYACFPNENITELLEFCYPFEVISIHEGICLFLVKDRSEVDSYDCQHFVQGCPTGFYIGSTVYKYPSCVLIGNGCFLAAPSCKSVTEAPFRGTSLENTAERTFMDSAGSHWISIVTVLGTFLLLCVPCILLVFFLRGRRETSKRQKYKDEENVNESLPLMINNSQEVNNEENRTYPSDDDPDTELMTQKRTKDNESVLHEETEFEKAVFCQWKEDDYFFYSTEATKEVENLIKNNNLVIITGHSGSGKSAIIQHIALKYRKEGWIVKPVYRVEEIHNAYKSMNLKSNKCLFVFKDPIGRECLDEILYNEWGRYRETVNILIKNGKLLMTCRKSICSDQRAKGFFKKVRKHMDINDSQCKLSAHEKRNIFKKHLPDIQLTEEDFAKICENEMYFPLLCKLYKGKSERKENVLNFFEKPVKVLQDEIESYKNTDKEKYCSLICLILSNNKLCINDLKGNNELFLQCLQLCELPTHTSTGSIKNKFDCLDGFLVKKIGQYYAFYHDFVMEVTTFVFGTDHPEEIIKFADLSFLWNRIRIENSQSNDFPTIVLNDDNIVHLVNRFFEEIFGNRFIEVVLNPCLRNEHVISGFKEKLKCLAVEKNLEIIIKQQKKTVQQDLENLIDKSWYSKLQFCKSDTKSSPLFALIAFCHDDLSTFCLKLLREDNVTLKNCGVFAAVCSNGNKDLVGMFTKDEISECMEEQWNDLYPVHIVSLFHNYNLLDHVIKTPGDINRFSSDMWTPLHLASKMEKSREEESTESVRREKTVEGLIQRGADVNLCNKFGTSPLWVACKNGHKNTAQLLLEKNAKVNEYDMHGITPLLEASRNGHESIVQLLLQSDAKVNACDNNKTTPLLEASRNGHESIVQLLLDKGAEVNSPDTLGTTPLLAARKNGDQNTVKLLLENGAM